MLSCLRNFYTGEAALRRGDWKGKAGTGHDPPGKVLGIVGLGGIGRLIAKKAALAFDMSIVYHNRHRVENEELAPGISARYCKTLDSLLEQSDVVCIAVPLNNATRNLISKREFGKMRKGSILVNIARGPIVNEEALLEALESGHLLSAGLDVFTGEPQVNKRLQDNERLTLTPHMGTWTEETLQEMQELTFKNAWAGLQTGKVLNPVNSLVPK